MLIGQGFNRLEQRITKALCSGRLGPKEAVFLHSISGKLEIYRERAILSDNQASWLYTILTNFEQGTKGRSSKSRTPAGSNRVAPPPSSSKNASESLQLERALAGLDGFNWTDEEPPRAFDISEAFEPATQSLSSSHLSGSSPSLVTRTES
jgi:hypothetical protein